MHLYVETFQRETGQFVAVVEGRSETTSEGGVGSGESERSAITDAVNSYFNRRTSLVIEAAPEPDRSAYNGLKREAHTPAQIKALLGEALTPDERPTLELEYEDSRGSITERQITPLSIYQRRSLGGFPEDYLLALDITKDENRSFRLDRIHRLATA